MVALAALGYIAYYFWMTPDYTTGEKAYNFGWMADGQRVELQDLEGNYVLLDFWGSWCGPCRKEHPKLVELYAEFSDKKTAGGQGFEIVSVGLETSENRWKAAIKKDGLVWPHHSSDFMRMKSPVAMEYGVREIPAKFLMNPEGVIIMVNPSFEMLEQRLQSIYN